MLSSRSLVTTLLFLLAVIIVGRTYLGRGGNSDWAGDRNTRSAPHADVNRDSSSETPLPERGGKKKAVAPTQVLKPLSSPSGDGAGCPSETPGDPRLQFPCSSRIKGHNSLGFFRWSSADEDRKQALLAPFTAACKKEHVTASSVFGRLVGCREGISGQWNRCWIIDMASDASRNTTVPICRGGSSFDVMLESPNAKVAVDRIVDLDNGIYEVIFFIRKRGTYNFCIDAIGSHDKCVGKFNFRLMGGDSNESTLGRVMRDPLPSAQGGPWKDLPRTPLFPKNQRCESADFGKGVDSRPLNVSCRASADRDRFRFGGWYKMPDPKQCDGVHCTGSALESMEGWVWASDVCIVHVYTRDELHRMLDKLWVIGWGGSTMKQPMSNFVEYYMGHPIFKFFMTQLDLWKSKKKAGFFSYRQWGVTISNGQLGTQTSWNMLWGGCPGLMAAPSQCTTTVGMRYWPRLDGLIGNRDRNATFPNAILLDHFVWRWPLNDEVQFSEQSALLFKKIAEAAGFGNHRLPLIVWHTGPSSANNDMSPRPDHCGQLHVGRHLSWTIEDDYDNNAAFRDVLLISRDQITLPLHFGNTFVHFGVHYGASEGMCNTGHSRSERYEFAKCVRRTWADDAVIIMWLNAIDQHSSSSKGKMKQGA
jgi:hypothetical protein